MSPVKNEVNLISVKEAAMEMTLFRKTVGRLMVRGVLVPICRKHRFAIVARYSTTMPL